MKLICKEQRREGFPIKNVSIFQHNRLAKKFALFSLIGSLSDIPSAKTDSGCIEGSSPPVCDASLWNHIWVSPRLLMIYECIEVSGTISSLGKAKDGDVHILLYPDERYRYLLNFQNRNLQNGALVLEPVCVYPSQGFFASRACGDFRQRMEFLPPGTHVRVVGSYVLDIPHGWMEIHPVTSIVLY